MVGLAPLVLWICALPSDADDGWAAVRGSLVFGAVYFGLVFYWILVALIWFTPLAILAFLASLILLMGVAALFGWMLHRMVHRLSVPLWVAVPVAWTAAEWFRAHWPGSLAFPWLGLGTSLTGYPRLVGIAEIVGARGVTFWLATINALVAGLVLRMREGRRWAPPVLAIAAVVGLPMAWGVWRATTLETRPAGRVALVQPNIPEHIKLQPGAALDSVFASLDRLVPTIASGTVDLVILPEVALPLYPRAPNARAPMARVQGYAREVGAPILLGALGYREDGHGGFVPYNSAFLVTPDGLSAYQYDKRYLVPMVERVPLLPSSWLRGLQYFGSFGVGEGWPLGDSDAGTFGVLVCYESAFAEGARTFRREGADFLVNITNDAWYGREPLYARTTALWQHPAHMVMRAIENRAGVARAANTGISMFIDPVGRIHDATPLFEPAVRIDEVRTTDVRTFFTRYGDLAGDGAALAALLLVAASFRTGRDEEGPLDPRSTPI